MLKEAVDPEQCREKEERIVNMGQFVSSKYDLLISSLMSVFVVRLLFFTYIFSIPWAIVNTYLNDFLSEDRGMSVEVRTSDRVTVVC